MNFFNSFKIIKKLCSILPYFFKIIYFNFHYLPFNKAIHLPILLFKPQFKNLKGKVIIVGGVKFGMIRLGFDTVCLYPSTGIMIDNNGTIVFNGSCCIGNDSYLSIGSKGYLEFGRNFSATSSLKIACYHNISFGKKVSVGWDCLFIDTDFHCMKDLFGTKNKGYGPIVIGNNNWFGNNCIVLKNTSTSDFITIAAGTQLNSNCSKIPSKSIIANDKTVKVIKTNIFRDLADDLIEI